MFPRRVSFTLIFQYMWDAGDGGGSVMRCPYLRPHSTAAQRPPRRYFPSEGTSTKKIRQPMRLHKPAVGKQHR